MSQVKDTSVVQGLSQSGRSTPRENSLLSALSPKEDQVILTWTGIRKVLAPLIYQLESEETVQIGLCVAIYNKLWSVFTAQAKGDTLNQEGLWSWLCMQNEQVVQYRTPQENQYWKQTLTQLKPFLLRHTPLSPSTTSSSFTGQ
ncbi:hypothetical protein [Mechercharimyces sp. CAU 1602]|uniref:hypothetical protein n=1 Tax=Mechercharimyces sp. CAU 1602 TaxID=2973933 RepID=UPI00216117C5|nr:hypothetical protein [Mechercharimyces sp. CAU 1602]MCS1350411.1 hypothetical protein [Mechercharimyces sp. CAU 1602]